MIVASQPADPQIHEKATAIARRFVEMVGGLLRDEEKGEAMREAYMITREELEAVTRGNDDAGR